jgi:hypothetical protein
MTYLQSTYGHIILTRRTEKLSDERKAEERALAAEAKRLGYRLLPLQPARELEAELEEYLQRYAMLQAFFEFDSSPPAIVARYDETRLVFKRPTSTEDGLQSMYLPMLVREFNAFLTEVHSAKQVDARVDVVFLTNDEAAPVSRVRWLKESLELDDYPADATPRVSAY